MPKQKSKPRQIFYADELQQLKEYILNDSSENAKRHLLYPLFSKIFRDKFKMESDAFGADVYIEGKLIVESKSDFRSWCEGFYQALHYQKRFGLSYNTIIVIAYKFVGIWKVKNLPEYAVMISHTQHSYLAPSEAGKENAKRTQKAYRDEIKDSAFYWLEPKQLEEDKNSLGVRSPLIEVYAVKDILLNLDKDRISINPHNFIDIIESMKAFFENPIDAVHAFYTIVAFWDITSTVAAKDNGDIQVVGFSGHHVSDVINIPVSKIKEFRRFIETHYIFTNGGSGLTVDYYFSRFDEVLAKLDPEYIKQHGIFFTDSNLSKFALWFAKYHFPGNINEDYIVFDPAGGSGNLISSWRGKLRHKIISELQPDLLRTIERRMKVDPWHIETGFTIIPKTSENKGLNFLDKDATAYLHELQKELQLKNIQLDKPIAFLLNPPYKNTREEENIRIESNAEYNIDTTITDLAGPDASKERYLAFLAQIVNVAKQQVAQYPQLKPALFIFTPTSWLIPRVAFRKFRTDFDKYFKYVDGFIINSHEFFSIPGSWPLAFTVWQFNEKSEGNENTVEVYDLTELKKYQLNNVNWNLEENLLNFQVADLIRDAVKINFSIKRGKIKNTLPKYIDEDGNEVKQGMQNFYRSKTREELTKKIISGFALKDDRHQRIKAPHGYTDGSIIGFMDDLSPVRLRPKSDIRYNGKSNRWLWFRLDTAMKDVNKSKCFNGPTDNRSYCAYDLNSAKATCSWFAITKALNGRYPLWANQNDIWPPSIKPESENYWYALCFAFVFAENRCIVTKFEKDNPVEGAPEVYVDNPLSPINKESFWSTTLAPAIKNLDKENVARLLADAIKELYSYWNLNYCKGQNLENVGLQGEPYFKYFNYPDFLTPHSGLIQIRKYAELEGASDLLQRFDEVSDLTKKVREELYRLLVMEFKYFE